jgi:hypothetical protein
MGQFMQRCIKHLLYISYIAWSVLFNDRPHEHRVLTRPCRVFYETTLVRMRQVYPLHMAVIFT